MKEMLEVWHGLWSRLTEDGERLGQNRKRLLVGLVLLFARLTFENLLGSIVCAGNTKFEGCSCTDESGDSIWLAHRLRSSGSTGQPQLLI